MHKYRFPGFGVGTHDERFVRGEVGRAEGRTLGEAQPLVQWESVGRLTDEVLRVGSGVPAGGENPLPHLQVGYGRSDGVDVAGSITARGVGELGQARVLTLPKTTY